MKLIYLVVTQVFAWLGLAGRGSATKDVEILMLRHQLAVAQRRDPRIARKLTRADRAWLLREYEDHYNGHRPYRSLDKAAPMRPLPANVIDLDDFRVRRRDRAGGLHHEYQQVV